MGAVYLRVGSEIAHYELVERQGFLKAALATLFCLAAFYLFDLYDFIVMHDRRELLLRLVQALGTGLDRVGPGFLCFPPTHAGPRHFTDRIAAGARIDGRLASVDPLVTRPP